MHHAHAPRLESSVLKSAHHPIPPLDFQTGSPITINGPQPGPHRIRDSNMPLGYLTLVLHAHLPYVRHPEFDDFLEEDWLYEAITETYIPLLEVFDSLDRDGVDWRVTMSVSPSLAAMLSDEMLQSRYLRHLDNLLALTTKELERTRW